MKLSGIILTFFLSFSIVSQDIIPCSTFLSEEDRLLFFDEQKTTFSTPISLRSEITIPIGIHLVANDYGKGKIDSQEVLLALNNLNIRFQAAGIYFQPCGGINYINKSEYAVFDKFSDETLCEENDLQDVLNIYFVPQLIDKVNQKPRKICGYTYYSDTELNRIIINNDCTLNGSTLAHEVGHFLSLLHTHETSNGIEMVNGSNCQYAGDAICDTAADPLLSKDNVENDCFYFGSETDVNGDLYAPDPANLMSYSPKNCRAIFTVQQIKRMRSYLKGYRSYLQCQNVSTHVIDLDEIFAHRLYPNPANDLINFYFRFSPDKISIFDMNGQIVKTIHSSQRLISVNITDLTSGVYLYSIIRGDKSYEGKFLVFR